jgi:tetratricopeptide (TPR) repeat protein
MSNHHPLSQPIINRHNTPHYLLPYRYYILGRSAHQQGDIKKAKDQYRSAIREWQQMDLAIFGLAQILFAEKKYGNSRTLFDEIEKRNPGDNDTRAYVFCYTIVLPSFLVCLSSICCSLLAFSDTA